MILTLRKKYILVIGAVLLSSSTLTLANDEANSISIPMVENAQVFANYSDSSPGVLNYYTMATEEQIIDFYRENFGESTSQEMKRKRLTLSYNKENQAIRVVISQQNNKRQVDVIIIKETQ